MNVSPKSRLGHCDYTSTTPTRNVFLGDFVTNPGIRVGNSYEQWHHSYFLPDGRQTIRDGVSRFCVWLLWGVEFIWKGTPFMFWLTAGTGGGGLVELRGLSLDWLWSLMPLRRLTERRGASQPAPKQVVKSGSWEESAVLACCLSGANHPSVFPTLYFWDVQGDFFTLGLPWKVKVWKT